MSTVDTTTGAEAPERCGQCGAPAAHEQRYCLNCGFHRRNAPDPVARYLSEASAALARVKTAEAFAAQRRRQSKLGLRAVAALVAVALLVGLVIGNATAGSPTKTVAAHRTTHSHIASKVKKATGESYIQQEENLPNSVTP